MAIVVDQREGAAVFGRHFAITLKAPAHAGKFGQTFWMETTSAPHSSAIATADRALSTLCSPGIFSTTGKLGPSLSTTSKCMRPLSATTFSARTERFRPARRSSPAW